MLSRATRRVVEVLQLCRMIFLLYAVGTTTTLVYPISTFTLSRRSRISQTGDNTPFCKTDAMDVRVGSKNL